jgi:hypothetical protein
LEVAISPGLLFLNFSFYFFGVEIDFNHEMWEKYETYKNPDN